MFKRRLLQTLKTKFLSPSFVCWLVIPFLIFLSSEWYFYKMLCWMCKNVLSGLNENWSGITFLLGAVFGGFKFFTRTKDNHLYIQPNHLALAIVFICIYTYYRFINDSFQFWTLYHNRHFIVCYTDVLYPLFIVFFYRYWVFRPYVSENKLFKTLNDSPIAKSDDDIFGYNNMAVCLLENILTADVTMRGLSVGVSGNWGAGKSSFLNLLANKVSAQKGNIVVRFNPRLSSSYQAISVDFFTALSSELGKYHTGVGRMIQNYIRSLRVLEGDGWFNRSVSAIECFFNSDEKSQIENAISQIGRNIFIFIEDLDRLTGKEILEILMIIDQSGNFKHTFFITAYDKLYINSVLSHYLGYDPRHTFTDKYFQYEFLLPAYSVEEERKFVRNYLKKWVVFLEEDNISQADLLAAWEEVGDQVVRALGSMRHIKRYLNIFMSRYPYVKNVVCIKDFMLVTLLRYKDIAAYQKLSSGDLVNFKKSLLYNCRSIVFQRKDLAKILHANPFSWEGTVNVFNQLFPIYANEMVAYDPETDFGKIRCIHFFNNYFFDSIDGKLQQTDLYQLFHKDKSEIQVLLSTLESQDPIGLELYLGSKSIRRLGSMKNLDRYIYLLLYLMKIKHQIECIPSFVRFLTRDDANEAVSMRMVDNITVYKKFVYDFISNDIEEFPVQIGLALVKLLNGTDAMTSSYLCSPNECIDWIVRCQRLYFLKVNDPDWNFTTALELSNVITEKEGRSVINERIRSELENFMKQQPKKIIKDLIYANVDPTFTLRIGFVNLFKPHLFFPSEEFTFLNWVEDYVEDEDARFVLGRVYETAKNLSDVIKVHTSELEYAAGDFESLAREIRRNE